MRDYQLGDSWEFTVQTEDPATGAAADADALPTWRLYEAGSDVAVASGTCAKRDDANTTGFYAASGSCEDLTEGSEYVVRAEAVVGDVTGAATVGEFEVIAPAESDGPVPWTITVYTSTGAPAVSARVWLTGDEAGVGLTLRKQKVANDEGKVIFHLDAGAAYWVHAIGADGEELRPVRIVVGG